MTEWRTPGESWKPLPLDLLQAEIDESVGQMSPKSHSLWDAMRISPEKWSLSPWGDLGGGFWVVAVKGNECVYFNDIEDGFNVSTFSRRGVIENYGCNQSKLCDAVHGMAERADTE
jgi:hypothetical protein